MRSNLNEMNVLNALFNILIAVGAGVLIGVALVVFFG